jgi:hypothetical protein
LANAVLKDYSVTNKLLKLVNSAFYGQFAGKITTVSRAVVVLGFEQVAMAASSLMLFEQLKNKGHSSELRDAAVGSFMSGLIGTGNRFIVPLLTSLTEPKIFSMMSAARCLFHSPLRERGLHGWGDA